MYSLWWYFCYYLRPVLKWFLRKTTGLCELQRICYGEPSGAPRIKAVEHSLVSSHSPQIQALTRHLDEVCVQRRFTGANERVILEGAVRTILLVKRINPQAHAPFVSSFGKCVEQIWGYRQLQAEAESLRKTQYDSDNAEHEGKLQRLWAKLMPDEPLEERVTRQWQKIGFQGDDPKTDFRGMGLLGLDNLLFFAEEFTGPACHVLSHSHHPLYGYCFAIVGINLTSMAVTLLKEGTAKTYFYNKAKRLPTIDHFHQFYSYLFYEFDRFWIECKPKDIMEFSFIKERFEKNIRLSLQDPTSDFRMNISVDTV